jgi:hypothetical protein
MAPVPAAASALAAPFFAPKKPEYLSPIGITIQYNRPPLKGTVKEIDFQNFDKNLQN